MQIKLDYPTKRLEAARVLRGLESDSSGSSLLSSSSQEGATSSLHSSATDTTTIDSQDNVVDRSVDHVTTDSEIDNPAPFEVEAEEKAKSGKID